MGHLQSLLIGEEKDPFDDYGYVGGLHELA